MHFVIEQTTWAKNSSELKQIRTQVFLIEQSVPEKDEWDNADKSAIHFLVRNLNNEPIGCARLITETINELTHFHLGRVAILLPYRSQGIGSALVKHIIHFCKTTQPERSLFLNAQISREAFYQGLQFVSRGEIFMDANIPHIEMWYQPSH